MDVEEIVDRESLRTWLGSLPESKQRSASVHIASRAALRVLPIALDVSAFWLNDNEWAPISIVRAVLVAEHPPMDLMTAQNAFDAVYSADYASKFATENGGFADESFAIDAVLRAAYAAVPKSSVTDVIANVGSSIANASMAVSAVPTLNPGDSLDLNSGNSLDYWLMARGDAKAYLQADDPSEALWQPGGSILETRWKRVRLRMPSGNGDDPRRRHRLGDWTFWIDWYEAHLAGTPLPVSLLTKIVQLPEELWTKDPAALNAEVMRIYEAWKASKAPPQQALLAAAITQFEYDDALRLMRAVPFDEDWKELDDPEHLQELLKDVSSFLKAMNRLERSLEYEGAGMQGAGTIRAYLEDIRGEFDHARDVGTLLIGEIVELRRALENLSKREALRAELAHLCEPLDDILRKLTEMLHKHFAATLARFSVLRGIELEDDVDPSRVVGQLRDMVDVMRTGVGGELPHLLDKDAASLDLMLDDLDRLAREHAIAGSPEQISSLKREMNFAMAKLNATGALYLEQANEALPNFNGKAKKTGEVIDAATKIEKRGLKVAGWGRRILDAFDLFGGG